MPKPNDKVPEYQIDFYWTPQEVAPAESVYDQICGKAGYPQAVYDVHIGRDARILETREPREAIESKFKDAIGSGYPYKSAGREGVINRVRVKTSL